MPQMIAVDIAKVLNHQFTCLDTESPSSYRCYPAANLLVIAAHPSKTVMK